MRHRKKINSLGRKAAHRKETMSSMATALILNKRINTTVAKAKALRTYVEPLITRSKTDNTHSRRMVFSYLKNKHAVSELFREVSQKIADRPGGYTRILKTGFRKGDAAEMCFIELVDYNTAMLATEEESQQKRTRRGRRRGKKSTPAAGQKPATEAAAPAETTEAPEETPKAETPEETTETKQAESGTEKAQEKKSPEAEAKETGKEAGTEEKPAEGQEEKTSEAEQEEPKAAKKEEPKAEKKEDSPADETREEGKPDEKKKSDEEK